MSAALSLFAACGVLFAPQTPTPAALAEALTKAVDQPTPALRQAAVDGLLGMTGDVDAWLAACRAFGAFEQLAPGPQEHTLELDVLGQKERTEVHLYVPQGYDPTRPSPLLLWLHGSGGSGAGQHLHWKVVADELSMLVLAPTEPVETVYAKTPRERASALAALRWARRRANVQEDAVFVGGWSRGGHMAWDLALRLPDLWAGLLPCVGGPRIELGPGNNMRYLENVAQLPIRDLQGSKDDPRLLMNLRLAFAHLKKLKARDAELIEFEDLGHSAKLDAVPWQAFFGNRREAWPRQVVRLAADPDETRNAWLELTGLLRKVQVDAQPMVAAGRWERMDEMQKREYLTRELLKSTARVEVTNKGKGRFDAEGTGVSSFALLLRQEDLGKDGKVEVKLKKGKPVKKTAAPSAGALLRHFVEHFDRTRLPVARVDVP